MCASFTGLLDLGLIVRKTQSNKLQVTSCGDDDDGGDDDDEDDNGDDYLDGEGA